MSKIDRLGGSPPREVAEKKQRRRLYGSQQLEKVSGGVLPVNLRVEDIAVRVEDDGEALEDVDKDFVLFVFAALPRQGNWLVHRTGGRRLSARHGQLGLRPGRLDGDGLVEDILL